MFHIGRKKHELSWKPNAAVVRILQSVVIPISLALGVAGPAEAQEETGWTLLLEPMVMDGFGHDQQVLSIQELDPNASPALNTRRPVSLDTEGGVTLRLELEWNRSGEWDFGLDGFLFSASRGRPARTVSADGPSGPIDQVVFNAWDRNYVSNGPGEKLFFDVLGDTDVAIWTIDVYAVKTLVESPANRLRLVLGLRNGDFDNDFHGQAGIQGVGGSFYDASSNYDLMMGPLVGISGDAYFGRNTVRGYIGQSILFGSTQLTHTTSDFIGPPTDPPSNIVAQDSFSREQDVAIPITELRINWLRSLGDRLAVGVSANASVWWDVPVPPGVVPATEGDRSDENTIVFFGIGAAIRFGF